MKLFLGDTNSLHGRGNFENRQIIQKEFIPLGLLLEFLNRLHSPFIKLTVENTYFRYFLYIQVFPYFRSPPHQLKICSFPPVDSSTTFLFPPTKSLFLPNEAGIFIYFLYIHLCLSVTEKALQLPVLFFSFLVYLVSIMDWENNFANISPFITKDACY